MQAVVLEVGDAHIIFVPDPWPREAMELFKPPKRPLLQVAMILACHHLRQAGLKSSGYAHLSDVAAALRSTSKVRYKYGPVIDKNGFDSAAPPRACILRRV